MDPRFELPEWYRTNRILMGSKLKAFQVKVGGEEVGGTSEMHAIFCFVIKHKTKYNGHDSGKGEEKNNLRHTAINQMSVPLHDPNNPRLQKIFVRHILGDHIIVLLHAVVVDGHDLASRPVQHQEKREWMYVRIKSKLSHKDSHMSRLTNTVLRIYLFHVIVFGGELSCLLGRLEFCNV